MTRTVLIVDDSATTRLMVRRMMQLAGLDVSEIIEASNGIEALAALADHHVDAVVLDINMPTMNGVQLVKRMKSSERLRNIPVVVASTEGSRQRIDELREYGVVGFVRKPFHPEQLRSVLQPLLGVCDAKQVSTNSTDSNDF